jgi:hypothetical protein
MGMANKLLQETVSGLLDASANFLERFAEAVAERLPSNTHETVTRAADRFLDHEVDSPIIRFIHADAAAVRLIIISRAFDGDAHSFVDAAVERSVARVNGLFEQDNVVTLGPRRI